MKEGSKNWNSQFIKTVPASSWEPAQAPSLGQFAFPTSSSSLPRSPHTGQPREFTGGGCFHSANLGREKQGSFPLEALWWDWVSYGRFGGKLTFQSDCVLISLLPALSRGSGTSVTSPTTRLCTRATAARPLSTCLPWASRTTQTSWAGRCGPSSRRCWVSWSSPRKIHCRHGH